MSKLLICIVFYFNYVICNALRKVIVSRLVDLQIAMEAYYNCSPVLRPSYFVGGR
jgi:hypothetical protein